jgi:2,4-dienoyl-CoA reductase-like NADH-dependent reductase (Old Yellow Enzyme family)
MSLLETPVQIGSMTLANRAVRSATHESLAEDGAVRPRLVTVLTRLARGQVGMIVTGAAAVAQEGRISPTQLALWDDRFLHSLAQLVREVHAAGDSRLIVQISHAGPHARGTVEPLAPSLVQTLALQARPRALTEPEIERILEAYAVAARRAQKAGADGVQFHMCHGDLPSSFMSTISNHREDRWGGPLENRIRFPLEVYHRARAAVGPDFPLMVKMNATDFKGGWDLDDAVVLARALAVAGLDAIEVSAGVSETWLGMSRGGVPVDMIVEGLGGGWLKRWITTLFFRLTSRRFAFTEAYLAPYALAIKDAVAGTPVIAVGGFRTRETMERTLAQGVDMVALSRPLIREPYLMRHMFEGKTDAASCVNCNRCVIAIGFQERPIRCYYEG